MVYVSYPREEINKMYSLFAGASFNMLGYTGKNDDAFPRIVSFMSRREGWRFGRGKPPSPPTVAKALATAALLSKLQADSTGAFLGEDGGILVTGYYSNWHIDLSCLPSDRYTLIVERNDEEVFAEEYTSFRDALKSVIQQVKRWGTSASSSDSFTLMSMTSNSAGFEAQRSPSHLAMEAFLSSAYTAQTPNQGPSVTISGAPNGTLPASPQFFGSSPSPIFRQVAA